METISKEWIARVELAEALVGAGGTARGVADADVLLVAGEVVATAVDAGVAVLSVVALTITCGAVAEGVM